MIDTNTPEFKRAASAQMILVGSRSLGLPLSVDYEAQARELNRKLCVTSTVSIETIGSLGVTLEQIPFREIASDRSKRQNPKRKCYYEKFKKPGINYR